MRRKITQAIVIFIVGILLTSFSYEDSKNQRNLIIENPNSYTDIARAIEVDISVEPSEIFVVQAFETEEQTLDDLIIIPESYFNSETNEYMEEEFWDDMELVALVCMGEAEGEPEQGKRLVIDTVFNRMESEDFPNTINEVVFQKNPIQYTCAWNGRINKVENSEYIANLVLEEYLNRTNDKVIYFNTGGYFNWGTKIIQVGNHYFNGQ